MTPPTAHLHYSYTRFALAKAFAFRMWQDFAHERQAREPTDLSGACKYGSLFMQQVFGGEIEGHYQHQFNRIDGRIVDLSHDAADVGAMRDPYLHDPDYFDIPEQRAALQSCMPRVARWTAAFLAEMEAKACVRDAGQQHHHYKPSATGGRWHGLLFVPGPVIQSQATDKGQAQGRPVQIQAQMQAQQVELDPLLHAQ